MIPFCLWLPPRRWDETKKKFAERARRHMHSVRRITFRRRLRRRCRCTETARTNQSRTSLSASPSAVRLRNVAFERAAAFVALATVANAFRRTLNVFLMCVKLPPVGAGGKFLPANNLFAGEHQWKQRLLRRHSIQKFAALVFPPNTFLALSPSTFLRRLRRCANGISLTSCRRALRLLN